MKSVRHFVLMIGAKEWGSDELVRNPQTALGPIEGSTSRY